MSSEPVVFMGVDPGHSGAIAFYRPSLRVDETALVVYDMPLQRKRGSDTRNEVDGKELTRLIKKMLKAYEIVAAVELVGARTYMVGGVARGQGAAASFAFGKSAGVVTGVLSALEIPFVEVSPGVWKSAMNLSSDKNASRELATKFFPRYPKYFERKKDDGRAEAALLAYFAWDRLRYGWSDGANT